MYRTFFDSSETSSKDARLVKSRAGLSAVPTADEERDHHTDPGGHTATFCTNEVKHSKYTTMTFIPLNLWEQFRRPINMYFLMVGLLQFIPILAPVNPFSTIMPLLFAFSLTAIKEGYDDLQRHHADNEFNNRALKVLRRGVWVDVLSKDVQVGDLIQIKSGGEVPCDIMLVFSTGRDGVTFIQTDNLDGETDLKKKKVPEDLQNISFDDLSSVSVKCDAPTSNLFAFASVVTCRKGHQSIEFTSDLEAFVPATCFIKNTESIIGIALYTGKQTKVCMSKKVPPTKIATLDRLTSKYSMVIFIGQMVVALTMGMTGNALLKSVVPSHWYLHNHDASALMFVIIPVRFFLLCSVMIPISFKVLVDLSKYYLSLTIAWDIHMYDPKSNSAAGVNNSAIAEDLGQVRFILSDKTGTLTENEMILRDVFIAGPHQVTSLSNTAERDELKQSATQGGETSAAQFTRCLMLCNTIEYVPRDSKSPFQGPSCDEVAMVAAVHQQLDVKMVQHGSESPHVVIKFGSAANDSGEEKWEMKHLMDFTSDRARMSVVLKEESSGRIFIFSKGSDEKMLPRMDPSTFSENEVTRVLQQGSARGLRTLVFASREVSSSDWSSFSEEYAQIQRIVQVDVQEDRINALYERLETRLTFVGVTGIEDRLQEGVPETIATLREAGIRIWMLTGDKIETAERIGHATNLLDPQSIVRHLSPLDESEADHLLTDLLNRFDAMVALSELTPRAHGSSHDSLLESSSLQCDVATKATFSGLDEHDTIAQQSAIATATAVAARPTNRSRGLSLKTSLNLRSELAIIVPGKCIPILLSERTADKFAQLCALVRVAIFARVSPSQKALIASFVQKNSDDVVCCVGDGGNDVPMIQAAQVGVGIRGKEGRQAARAADFSIGRFKFLAPLILVHGHYALQRSSYIVLYSFYKSMLLAVAQILINMYALCSGRSFWDSMGLLAWNGIYTMPTILFYVLDRVLPRDVLLSQPSLYTSVQDGKYFSAKRMFGFCARGIIQCLVVFFCAVAILGVNFVGSKDGHDINYTSSLFIVPYAAMLCIQTWILPMESHTMTWLNQAAVWGMLGLFWVSMYIYNTLTPKLEFYSVFNHAFGEPVSIFYIMLVVAAVMVPQMAWQHVVTWVKPTCKVDEARREMFKKSD